MIQCEVCGKQLPDDAAFCPRCGTIVKSRLEAEKQAKKKNKTKYLVLGVIATVFAFAYNLRFDTKAYHLERLLPVQNQHVAH